MATSPRRVSTSIEPGPSSTAYLPRRVDDLGEPMLATERMLGLANARVVFADYELLLRDFPQLGFTGRSSRSDVRRSDVTTDASVPPMVDHGHIDEWLLRHAGLISEPQAAQTVVNLPVPTRPSTVIAHRPPRYGRSAIVEVAHDGGSQGLLDLKGIGVRAGTAPSATVHGHGLLSLDLALQELLNQLLVEAACRHAQVEYRTVPVYAVLDAGFDAREYWSGHDLVRPCAVLVRRAHRRELGGLELPTRGSVKQFVLAEIEMLLRSYGITSAGPWSTTRISRGADGVLEAWLEGQPVTGYSQRQLGAIWKAGGSGRWTMFEGINIQTTRNADGHRPVELVDFGHFSVRSSFEHPVLSLVDDRPLRWGGVLLPDDPAYVQPHPRVRAPFALWGVQTIQPESAGLHALPSDFRLARSLDYAMTLATRWRSGEMNGDEVRAAVGSHLSATVDGWDRTVRRRDVRHSPRRRRAASRPTDAPVSATRSTSSRPL